MPLRILGVVTVELPVSDLDRSIVWYEAVLGFRCTWRGEGSAMLASPEGVSLRFFLVRTDDPLRLVFRSTTTGAEHSVVDFKTPDLAGCHRALLERGLVQGELKPGMHGFGFRDPDGHHLAVCDV